ncbi:MAG: hypothetical protein WCV67_18245 [Victivallaceae bacterium]
MKARKAREVVKLLCSTTLQSVGMLAVQNGFGVVPSVPDGAVQNGRDECPECL